MKLTQLKNDELTHHRLTITVNKEFNKILEDCFCTLMKTY